MQYDMELIGKRIKAGAQSQAIYAGICIHPGEHRREVSQPDRVRQGRPVRADPVVPLHHSGGQSQLHPVVGYHRADGSHQRPPQGTQPPPTSGCRRSCCAYSYGTAPPPARGGRDRALLPFFDLLRPRRPYFRLVNGKIAAKNPPERLCFPGACGII